MRRNRRFALQAVLDYRRHAEEEAGRVVAALRRMESAHNRAIERCHGAAVECLQTLHAAAMLKIAEAQACEFQLAVLRDCADRHVAEAAGIQAPLERACRDAVEATRDRRAIETLRDRHLAKCTAAQRRVEEEDIAEIDALRARSEMRRP